jgi:hypothetical protein
MLGGFNLANVSRFPTCPNKCEAHMFPSGYLMSNGSSVHTWDCDSCGSCVVSQVATTLINSKLRSIKDYELALEYVLLEEELKE